MVLAALSRQGGEATLSALYAEVYDAAPERVGNSPHWQAKVRQTLQRAPGVTPGRDRGTWKLAS